MLPGLSEWEQPWSLVLARRAGSQGEDADVLPQRCGPLSSVCAVCWPSAALLCALQPASLGSEVLQMLHLPGVRLQGMVGDRGHLVGACGPCPQV